MNFILLELNIFQGPYKFSLQATTMETLLIVVIILLLSIAMETFCCNDDRITECNTIDTRNS